MIYTQETNTFAYDPSKEVNKIEGIHYAVICNVQAKDENIFYCTLYIPDVYGEYNQSNQNYPMTEIPYKQDNDDPGYIPKIGDICKVMFDDGNSYTCRFIYLVPIRDEIRLLNEDYIINGILPVSLITKPDDPNIYNKFSGEFLDFAYFITTGHRKNNLTFNDFDFGVLGTNVDNKNSFWGSITSNTNLSAGRNYFCKALGVPFMSYVLREAKEPAYIDYIDTSPNFNIKNIISNNYLYIDDISYLYKDNNYVVGNPSLQDVYNRLKNKKIEDLDKTMSQITLGLISYVSPEYTNIMFPDINKDTQKQIDKYFPAFLSSNIYISYPEFMWYRYKEENINAYNKILYSIRDKIEIDWMKQMSVYYTGLSTLYATDTDTLKLKYTYLYCLTICPYLAYVLFRQKMGDTYIGYVGNYDNPNIRNYISYISTDEEFSQTSNRLRQLIEIKNPKYLVKNFQNICYNLFNNGKLEILGENINCWNYSDMDAKFDRLSNNIENELSKLTI